MSDKDIHKNMQILIPRTGFFIDISFQHPASKTNVSMYRNDRVKLDHDK